MSGERRDDVDQQLIVHLFAPAEGPGAAAGYSALSDVWLGCRQFFLMREAIPGTGLPRQLPPTLGELTGSGRYLAGEEVAIAAQERSDADCQAVLRRHHDLLNLSLVLAGPEGNPAPASGGSWWQDLDSQWSFLAGHVPVPMLGEARIYMARSDTPPGSHLDDLLPAAARVAHWERDRAATEGRLALWEALPWTDGRSARRLVLAFDGDEESHRLASVWAWSRGDTAIPPLARYLLHAAKLRAWYREWQDKTAGRGRVAGGSRDETRRLAAGLRTLRKSVEITQHNMGLTVSSDSLLAPAGPFADDRNLARWLQAQLDDDISSLAIAADRAAPGTSLAAPGTSLPTAPRGNRPDLPSRDVAGPGASDITRNVFVVHGRDEQASRALTGFLEALGLHPLGWETLVEATGTASPYLRDVIMRGIAMAQAAVVLMTPDDTVWLHDDLREPDEDVHEALPAMQPRPNVILELGMALAAYADRTIVLVAGKHRPMADLGGLNYVRLADGEQCLEKIRRRLKTAGCQVNEASGWGTRAWFSDLAAYTRGPAPR